MKKVFILFWIFFGASLYAQYNEVGVFVGGANAVTDVGQTTLINPEKLALGILYKRNFHKQMAFRVDAKMFTLQDDDAKASSVARTSRRLSYSNEITEFSAGLEYNFFEFDTHKEFAHLFTPYLFAGVTYFRQDDLFFSTIRQHEIAQKISQDNKTERVDSWAIPFALGVKAKIGGTRFLFGAEVSAKYTFSNNLDGSMPSFDKETKSRWFGNRGTNDWYFVTGFYITYTFGQKPCQCY